MTPRLVLLAGVSLASSSCGPGEAASGDVDDDVSTRCIHAPGASAVAIDTISLHTCALLSDGTTWCWGRHGVDIDAYEHLPVQAEAPCFVEMGVGALHRCGRTEQQEVFCWGGNTGGQLGVGDKDEHGGATAVPLPKPAVQLDVGASKACILTEDHAIYCWGGGYGEKNWLLPTVVDGFARTVAIGDNVALIRLDGTLWSWGRNSEGQLGNGTTESTSELSQVLVLEDVIGVGVGYHHACAVDRAHALSCWGSNDLGQLGLGDKTNRLEPVGLTGLPPVAKVSGASAHTCAVTTDGAVYCWGRNTGCIGDGTYQNRLTPVKVVGLEGEVVVDIALGTWHTCALTAAGDVYCWGEGVEGQLGVSDPPPGSVAVPTKVHCSWCEP